MNHREATASPSHLPAPGFARGPSAWESCRQGSTERGRCRGRQAPPGTHLLPPYKRTRRDKHFQTKSERLHPEGRFGFRALPAQPALGHVRLSSSRQQPPQRSSRATPQPRRNPSPTILLPRQARTDDEKPRRCPPELFTARKDVRAATPEIKANPWPDGAAGRSRETRDGRETPADRELGKFRWVTRCCVADSLAWHRESWC